MTEHEQSEIAVTHDEPKDTIQFKAMCECGGVYRSYDNTSMQVLECRDCEKAVRYSVSYEEVDEVELRKDKESTVDFMEWVVSEWNGQLGETFIPGDAYEDVEEWR